MLCVYYSVHCILLVMRATLLVTYATLILKLKIVLVMYAKLLVMFTTFAKIRVLFVIHTVCYSPCVMREGRIRETLSISRYSCVYGNEKDGKKEKEREGVCVC